MYVCIITRLNAPPGSTCYGRFGLLRTCGFSGLNMGVGSCIPSYRPGCVGGGPGGSSYRFIAREGSVGWVPSARGSHARALVAPGLRNTDFDGPIATPHAHTVRMRTCGAPKISLLILGLGSRPGPDPYKAYPVCPSSRPPSRTKVARSPTSERRAPVDFSPVDTVAGS